MIYTMTFNPSLDYIVTVENLAVGLVNRTKKENIYPGGKGINVSMVLGNLGIKSTALGFVAGFTGDEIISRLGKSNVEADFIKIADGMSRINAKVHSCKSIDGSDKPEETEINGMGPVISKENLDELYSKIDVLGNEDILVLAGSIPSSMPETVYSDIMEYLSGRETKIVVDATGKLLMETLKNRPFLIKPNNHELGDIFGVELKSREDVVPYAEKLQALGARNVLVSLAGEGAVLIAENGKVYKTPAPEGIVVNAVGAGDSMVAGFLAGYIGTDVFGDTFLIEKYCDKYDRALKVGACAGSASAFKDEMASAQDVEQLLISL